MTDYVIGSPSFFNEDSKFFRDVYIYGKLHYDFKQNDPTEFNNVIIRGTLDVYGKSNFYDDVYLHKNLSVGILTVRTRLDVGIGGTVIKASTDTGKVGIGSTAPIQKLDVVGNALFTGNIGIGATTIPEQRLDIGGSVKIDKNIYDSVNVPGKNGYELVRDERGIRWIPLISDPLPGVPGIPEEGIFILNEFTPLDAPGNRETYSTYATYATNAGIATYANSSGIATYAASAGIATELQYSRTFGITGNFITAPSISFNGTGNVSLAATITADSIVLGTYTSGDYVKNISGTTNQITVTGGTGEGSTPTLSLPNNLVLPQDVTVTRDLQVNRNLSINGTVTIGGTSTTIFSQELKVGDPDIVLGFRTGGSGNDISNDNTSNHGGVALASTEGSPLVQLFIAGIETNPATYKKIMWFKKDSFTGLGTDAWLINYAVGIGSTQFPTGTRLAAGNVQFTQNDLAVVRNINASGIITAAGQFQSTQANSTTTGGGQIYLNGATGNRIDFNTNGVAAPATTTRSVGTKLVLYPGVSGSAVDFGFGIDSNTLWSSVPTSVEQFKWYAGTTNIATLFGTGELVLGTTAKTGTASQPLQVTGGAYVSGSFGIGITNPIGLTTGSAQTLHLNGTTAVLRVGPYYSAGGDRDNILLVADGTDTYLRSNNERFHIYNNSGDILLHGTSDVENIRITSGGNLGIGTNNIWSKVQIVADSIPADNGSMVTIATGGGNLVNKLNFGVSSVNNYAWIQSVKPGTDVYPLLLNPSGGNVGVGTAIPAEKLHIHSDLAVIRLSGSAVSQTPFNIRQGIVGTSNAGFSIYDVNNSATRFAIDSSGNVGIGTLTVTGGVYAASTSGFYSTTYAVNARNPIWRFGNADGYGLSYFKGTSGVSPSGGGDTLGFHFGTATAAASLLQLNNGSGAVVNGTLGVSANLIAWDTTTPGTGVGGLHLGAASGTSNAGPSITFGARDAFSGTNGQAGIYINSDGTYGTRMYFATTDSYAVGSKVAMSISETGTVTLSRSGLIVAGQFQSTQANSTTTGGGQIYLNGATGNRIDFNTNGVAAPATTTRSVGTKIVLFPNISATQVDYALGIDGSTLWSSVESSAASFKWYAGITNIATLSGAGALSVTGTVSGTNITTGGNVTGSSASVENAATFNNGGAGAASGTTFNGSAARTISYNTLGASPLAGSSSLVTTGTVTSGTWSGSFGAVSGANLTSLTAGNLSGTIPSGVLGNSTHYIGTTAISLNRASAAQSLTGINIDGSSASCNGNAATATNVAYSGLTGTVPTWNQNTTGNAATATSAGKVSSPDGDRNASTKLPTTTANAVRFDFSSASSAGTSGNYAGVMTYAPWDGTTASTGDASYQLAFGSTATNGGGIPKLNIRKGIDSTWNSWYTLLHSGNYTEYSPSLTGSGASGSWGISVTGTAASETLATVTGRGASTTVNNISIGDNGGNTGLQINHGAGSGDYGRIRFYQAGTNNQTIHVFATAWQGGTLASASAGAINLTGANGVTFGAWNNADMWIDTGGISQSRTSSRAPIFHDSDNTGYYTDPASTSSLNAIFRTNTRVATAQKVPLGHYTPGETVFEIDPTWTDIEIRNYFNSNNVSWVADSTAPGGYAISIVGNVNVGGVYTSGFPYIPVDQDDIFYMECWVKNVSTNNAHYMGSIDYNESFGNLGGNPGSFGYWVMSNSSPGAPVSAWVKYCGYIGGFSAGTTGTFKTGTKYFTPQALFNYSGGGTTYISGWKCIKVTNYGSRTIIGRTASITGENKYALDVYHPTDYYQLRIRAVSSPLLKFSGSYNSGNGAEIWQNTSGSLYFNINGSSNALTSIPGPYTIIYGSARSPIFYDQDNTGCYVDPNNGGFNLLGGTSNRVNYYTDDSGLKVSNAEGTTVVMRLGAAWGRPGVYSNSYLMLGSESSITFFIANAEKGYIDSSSNLFAYGSVRSPIFYDSNDTAYYTDPASGSPLQYLKVSGTWGSNPFGSSHAQFVVTGEYASIYQTSTIGNLGYMLQHIAADGAYYLYGGRGAVNGSSWDWSQRNYPNQDGSYVEFRTSARAPIFYDRDNPAYYCDPASTSYLNILKTTNWIYLENNYGHSIVSTYSSTIFQGVFAMGDSYKLTAGGGINNLYGMCWSYPSAGGIAGNLDSHGMIVAINGGFGSCMSYSIKASGNVTAYSDERLKRNWKNLPENFVELLSKVKSGSYDRIDGEQLRQVGASAQSLRPILPEAVIEADDEIKTLSISYGNAALVSAIELAKEVVNLKEQLNSQNTIIQSLINRLELLENK